MNMEKCKYLLFCGTLALWMAGSFQQVYAATEPSSQAILELTEYSVRNGSVPVRIPDFTRGAWEKLKSLEFAK